MKYMYNISKKDLDVSFVVDMCLKPTTIINIPVSHKEANSKTTTKYNTKKQNEGHDSGQQSTTITTLEASPPCLCVIIIILKW